MTTFYLIRHGSNDYLTSALIGRKPGIHLNAAGRRDAELLAERLAREKIERIYSSPMERCRETAEPIARALGLPLEVSDSLNEVDFGDWTGKTFPELDADELWKRWNTVRSAIRAPNGETMHEVQARMLGFITRMLRDRRGQQIALVSHGDPIRSVLLYYLGMPMEFIRRLELGPASVSVLTVTDWDIQVRALNARCGEGLQAWGRNS